jgi:phosphatidylserine/phosphatidylglycerophosphate/cardiolipin synthase-like enzyme
MKDMEALGVDVRYFGRSVKMHHKYAVIDSDNKLHRVITGSANWSLNSYRNYNENILFAEDEAELTYQMQREFNRLWDASKEFGVAAGFTHPKLVPHDVPGLEVYFNSARRLEPESPEVSNLTSQIVRLISESQKEVLVASTRVRLEPVLEAIAQAAKRGVKVKIVLSQDDYRDLDQRAKWLFSSENIEVRVKFYNLRPAQYMAFQMHNKFMIVDRKILITGSFNWSASSENNHIENLMEFQGPAARDVLPSYLEEFKMIWDLNRESIELFTKELAQAKEEGRLPRCGFKPTVFVVGEIRELLKEYPRCR